MVNFILLEKLSVFLVQTFIYIHSNSKTLNYGAKLSVQSFRPLLLKPFSCSASGVFQTVSHFSTGSSLLRARAGGHEENPAADRRQPAGVEAHRGRTAAGVSDAGGGSPENARKAEGRAGPGNGRGSGKPGEVPQAAGVTHRSGELGQGRCER